MEEKKETLLERLKQKPSFLKEPAKNERGGQEEGLGKGPKLTPGEGDRRMPGEREEQQEGPKDILVGAEVVLFKLKDKEWAKITDGELLAKEIEDMEGVQILFAMEGTRKVLFNELIRRAEEVRVKGKHLLVNARGSDGGRPSLFCANFKSEKEATEMHEKIEASLRRMKARHAG